MRNREIAAHGGCNLFLRPKSKERATNTAFRWGYGVDSKHSKRVPVCGKCLLGQSQTLIPKGGAEMENRKRNIQMKFYVTEEEKRLIDEKMKQLPIKQYGAYFRKMAIDGYILVVDRSDTKAYIRELQAVSRNINQIAKRANATGTVYRQDIEDIKKAVDEIWRLQRRTLLNQP